MRILLISHDYNPIPSPRAFRWTALAEDFVRRYGATVDVVARAVVSESPQDVIKGVNVYRVGGATSAGSQGLKPGAGIRIARAIWRFIRWPDYACRWYFPALRQSRKLSKQFKYDVLLSVSHPFTGHLVAYKIHKENPDMKWVVDIGDPFAFLEDPPVNNPWLYKPLNYAVERLALLGAKKISVTTSQTAEAYTQQLGIAREKILVIPPLLTVPTAKPSDAPGESKKLVYFGTLYRGIRSPEPLLRIFRGVCEEYPDEKYELHFYGMINDCGEIFDQYKDLIGKRVFVHGLVSRERVEEIKAESHALIHIGNLTKLQLPSKTVEYMASGKPIVNLVPTLQDTSLEIFANYPAVHNIVIESSFSDESVRALKEFVGRAKNVSESELANAVRSFSLEKVSGQYWSLIT